LPANFYPLHLPEHLLLLRAHEGDHIFAHSCYIYIIDTQDALWTWWVSRPFTGNHLPCG
jgi:hypothetical protein